MSVESRILDQIPPEGIGAKALRLKFHYTAAPVKR